MAQTELADSSARYEVTASKYRPKTFDELAGQEFVVSTIKNSLKTKNIAHAYLFSGPRGCGKTSAARILARSLNCEKGPAEGPCNASLEAHVCDSCRAISRGSSMDVLEIDGASNNSVNDVRQIKDEVLFPPHAGQYKVYIIDEVHMLSPSAFNALLKTIEEPPPYIVFIFATTELHKVPATIKSRCQQFNFRLIPIETIQGILKKICAENGIKAEDDALFWIARESTGSMRDAFTLFDQVVSFSAGNIRSDLIREKLGIIGLEKINALAEACAANDAPSSFALTDEILSSGVAIEQFVIDLTGYYRSLLLLKNGINRESILGFKSSLFSEKVLDAYDSIRLEQALDILLDCYRNIRYSVSPRFEIETAVSKLTWLNKWVSPVELKSAIDETRKILLTNNERNPQGSQTPQKQAEAVSPNVRAAPLPVSNSASNGEGSLASEFQRMIAAKEAGQSTVNSVNTDDDDDAPMWGNLANNQNTPEKNSPDFSQTSKENKKPENNGIPPQVEQVRDVIPGTIIP
ncbi:MAG: DNA polymerase III subunit gamma/tau [Treponema sp.]|nr:DNA polymerase III subunit gamma/tau [Treponema sp.]MCL2251789.1 DNA polymerase III subunit gamma/tau [Treponema sp.]